LDGRGEGERFLLKPIDKVPQGGMSSYPGFLRFMERDRLGCWLVLSILVKCGFDPKMQISNRYPNVWKSANIDKIHFSDGLDLRIKPSCLVDTRTDEENAPVSCGRFSLTYHSLFRIFNSSQSKFLSLSYRFEQNIVGIMPLGLENCANR
jgi:hypothetical protein